MRDLWPAGKSPGNDTHRSCFSLSLCVALSPRSKPQARRLLPVSDARWQTPWSGPACSYRALYHNGSGGSRPAEGEKEQRGMGQHAPLSASRLLLRFAAVCHIPIFPLFPFLIFRTRVPISGIRLRRKKTDWLILAGHPRLLSAECSRVLVQVQWEFFTGKKRLILLN